MDRIDKSRLFAGGLSTDERGWNHAGPQKTKNGCPYYRLSWLSHDTTTPLNAFNREGNNDHKKKKEEMKPFTPACETAPGRQATSYGSMTSEKNKIRGGKLRRPWNSKPRTLSL